MFRKEFRQLCRKCKGTGTSSKIAVDRDGKAMIRDTYTKGDPPAPLYENCLECNGEGRAMYASPNSILVDGEKVQLTPDQMKERYNDTFGAN